ncbi:MAG: 50S ribosomal protein L13 [Deltaproteobacteria bacterium]|nr:50S ribosomal protein L13 [Deltaproteobacteria bacterium]
MGTHFQSKEEGLKSRKWLVVDAAGIPLGRLASEVAALLRGKHKATYTPHTDGGDFVIVTNASKVKFTGRKLSDKVYYRHSQYIGGIKQINAEDLLEKNPQRIITDAIKGMLPKGPLGRSMATKLKVYSGSEHPHSAQTPKPYKLQFVEAA